MCLYAFPERQRGLGTDSIAAEVKAVTTTACSGFWTRGKPGVGTGWIPAS